MINWCKRNHPGKFAFWSLVALGYSLSYLNATITNKDYMSWFAGSFLIAVALAVGLIISINHWLDQRSKKIEERKKRSYRSIQGIDSCRFQARPK